MGSSRREGAGGGEAGASDEAGPSRLDGEEGAPGPFPSWGWLYAAVIVYTAGLTLLLWVFSVTLDHGAP